jgi:RNase adaptor protein for sRNA GlmZ degradation
MTSKLIIIRGNSGSGKSTVAKKLQHKMGYGTMLIPKDIVRRDILRVKDGAKGHPTSQLVYSIASFGRDIGYDVIIEGIFSKETYGVMMTDLIKLFNDKAHVYYFDISFEETLRRHAGKPKAAEFGEIEMRSWWKEKDYLEMCDEKLITDEMGEDEIVDMIYNHVVSG